MSRKREFFRNPPPTTSMLTLTIMSPSPVLCSGLTSNYGIKGCLPSNWKGKVFDGTPSEPSTRDPVVALSMIPTSNMWCANTAAPAGECPSIHGC